MESSEETREDDGRDDATTSSDTCVALRYGARRQVIDLRDDPTVAEVIIGRSSGSTFVADDERVSRRHLRIWLRDGALWAADLGSRNGSTLNGRPLDGERVLEPGDELAAGPVRVTVCGTRPSVSLVGEGELWRALSAEVARALRIGRPLALVGLQLDGTAGARRAAALRVAARLGRGEHMGQYAPGAYLALFPEMERGPAGARADQMAALAREVAGIESSARAVVVPDDGVTVDELVAAALRAAAPPTPTAVIAEDPAMRAVLELARRAARSDVSVLLVGETGSGKEVVANEIHLASARAAGPFVRINCASLPATLLESELFGHERGAFTGASRRRIGFVEAAHGGTLLLDEIGELPPEMQAKLLRVLEARNLTRVGGTEEVAVDVRFLSATHRDLERAVAEGHFREDLLFRINAIMLRVPSLRERPADVPLLARRFAERACAATGRPVPHLSAELMATLQRYPWPGNVRELRNVIERALVLGDAEELTPAHLPERLAVLGPAGTPPPPMREQVDELERRSLVEALRETGGNRTHAARRLGLSRRALLYKLKKHGLE
jgi:transcriptional regulator with AAA-type ATPase domain